jgi:ferredoxin/flavodoxin---NADP+ reductase
MTYVIKPDCCGDASCVPVCPVQCIRPRPGDPDFTTSEQLYIDPVTCIDCGACVDVCPVEAIDAEWDLLDEDQEFLDINAEYFLTNPIAEASPADPIRRRLPPDRPALSVAVVGSGPAGCYAVAELSSIPGVNVSVFDRLPTPFGLVRAGVAPDHQKTKLIMGQFGAAMARPNVQCYYNVEIGRDLSLDAVLEHHHAVIWAGGATDDRLLGIPGENLPGVFSGRQVVAWYNGHPDFADLAFRIDSDRVVVIGNGNVALDIARVLARPIEGLRSTDVADHTLDVLAESALREVVVTARRGPEHAAYSTGELLALVRVPGLRLRAASEEVGHLDVRDRRAKVLSAAAAQSQSDSERSVVFRYGMVPESINGAERVESITFRRGDGSRETIGTTTVVRAIGYRGTAVPGLPFDGVTGTLAHVAGRVVDPVSGEEVIGVYCAGWIKRGATGIIGSNKPDTAETIDSLLHDLAAGRLGEPSHDREHLGTLIGERGIDVVDKGGWNRIDQLERKAGRDAGRPRRKLTTYDSLLAAARGLS